MRRLTLCLLTAGVLLAPAGARADETTGRLLVTLDDQASTRAQSAALRAAGARTEGRSVPEIDMITVSPRAGTTITEALRALRAQPAVRAVAVERRAKLRFVPNDPALSAPEQIPGTPAGTTVQWWAQRSNLPQAWDVNRGASATVAVIDTGADAAHPELAGKIAGSFDVDSNPAHGPATIDENGHGTHVSSLACGAGNNGQGIVGAGLDCRLLIYKSDLSDGSVAAAVVDAANRGAQSINMSFGTDGSLAAPPALVDAFNFAVSKNVVLVAAAADQPVQENGDPSNVLQPTGSGPNLGDPAIRGLSITASQFDGARAPFAGVGTQISMAAYGYFAPTGPPGILAAFPGNQTELDTGSPALLNPSPPCNCRAPFNGDTRYAYLAGTSMSSPMVAAVAALMRDLNPDLSALEIVRILKERATRPAGSGWTPELGWGILNGGAALTVAALVDRRPPASRLKGPKTVRRARSITLKWTGADVGSGRARASGIARYEIFRSANGSKKFKRIATSTKLKRKMKVKRGSRYRFYVVAVDNAGNREAAPAKPDLTTRVAKRKR